MPFPLPTLSPARIRSNSHAFTVMEMLAVLVVLAILATIGVSVGPGAMEASRVKKAEGDLLVIQQALELYKERFGDYPRLPGTLGAEGSGLFEGLNGNSFLLNALCGKFGPTHAKVEVSPMLNVSVLDFKSEELPLGAETVTNTIVDPWENEYVYDYRPTSDSWDIFGYVLYSFGPDGKAGTQDDVVAK